MLTIHDFLEPNRANNVTIQMALREIDTGYLALLMLDLTEEDQEIIIRNMSKRAANLLREEMEYIKDTAAEYKRREAMEFYLQSLTKNAKYMSRTELKDDQHLSSLVNREPDAETELPDISTEGENDILEAFMTIQRFVRKNGILALHGNEDKIDDQAMRKGIEYFVDGWDPMLIQNIMEKYKKVYLKRVEHRLDMILEGLDSLASKEHPMVTEERLQIFL